MKRHGSKDEQRELIRRAQGGCKASRDRLLEENQGLVLKQVRRFDLTHCAVTVEDLVQEGTLGLNCAIKKFDLDRRQANGETYAFSTYATPWIRQYMQRLINSTGQMIRTPNHHGSDYVKIANIRDRLTQELGHCPTYKEIAAQTKFSARHVQLVLNSPRGHVSFDASLHPGTTPESLRDELHMGDLTLLQDPMDRTEDVDIRDWLADCLSVLSPSEQKVLRDRSGLDTGQACSLQQVGDGRQISRERVRQIEAKALKKIRRYLAEQPLHQEVAFDYLRKKEAARV